MFVALTTGLTETDRTFAQSLGDNLVQPDESATGEKQNVRRVHLNVLLLRMLAAPLWWNIRHRAFEHLQQRLLHAFPADIAGNRHVLAGFADLVDFVDVQNAALGRLDIKIGSV